MDEQGRDVAVHLTCRNGLIDGKTFVVMPQHVHLKLNGENLFSYYKAFAVSLIAVLHDSWRMLSK